MGSAGAWHLICDTALWQPRIDDCTSRPIAGLIRIKRNAGARARHHFGVADKRQPALRLLTFDAPQSASAPRLTVSGASTR